MAIPGGLIIKKTGAEQVGAGLKETVNPYG